LSSDPLVWTLISGHGRLLVYQFWSPKNSRSKLLLFVGRRVEARRQRKGGRTRIAVNYDGARERHAEATAWLDPVLLPFIASCVVKPIPDARAKLGLVSDRRLALMFGGVHAGKNPEVVWRAFQTLPEWQLIIAGAGAADAYRAWRGNQAEPAIEPALIDGFASEEVRQLLHSAVDLVVLSFQAGLELDSGTLIDAISHGLPVVCSDQCAPGRLAEHLAIGSNFVSGDAKSLAEVVRNVPTALDPATIEHARDETSSSRMARMHLAALGRQPSAVAKP
jgi:glycosyltransferase involved in cell wall biosynthesis